MEQTKPTETEAALKPLREAKQKIYDYCVDLKPEKSILLLVEECGQELALRLSYDDALWSYLAPAERTDADEE